MAWSSRCFVLLLLLVGCRRAAVDVPATLHSVKGQLVNGNNTVRGGMLLFHALDEGPPRAVNADVDENGRFELATVQGGKRIPGAPEGKYRVVYSPPNPVIGEADQTVTLAGTCEIRPGDNNLTLDLSKRE